jgi:hypothetical protein
MRQWFLIFCILIVKFLLASMKTLTDSGDFTGSHITISSDVCHLKVNGKPQSSFENADSQPSSVNLESNTVTRCKIISGLWNNLQNQADS